jgi:CheY-like chemotaxis protein
MGLKAPSMSSLKTRILHLCAREHLLPLRDHALRNAGYAVESVGDSKTALTRACSTPFDMVIIDVESDAQMTRAEEFCEHIRQALPDITVAFACNWQVSRNSQCPDEVIHTEFNPDAFVSGIRQMLKPN